MPGWLRFGLVLLAFETGLASGAPVLAETCKLQELVSLDLTTTPEGYLLVPVTIAGSQRRLALQLGAAYTMISDHTATELSLDREHYAEGASVISNGQPVVQLARAPAFRIGPLQAENVKLLVQPADLNDPTGDGILGLDYLHGQDFELDITHARLNLFSREHCAGQVIYWKPPGGVVAAMPLTIEPTANMLVHMQLDGSPVLVGITTGGPSEMTLSTAHRLFALDEHSPNLRPASNPTAPDETYYSYPFKVLQAEGLAVQNPDILIERDESGPGCDPRGRMQSKMCFGGAEVFLGLSVLRKLHLYFAFGEKVLYATAAQ